MTWQPHPFAFALLVSAALAIAVAQALWRRQAPGAGTCAVLMAALAWWSAFYAIELLHTTNAAQLAWVKIEYLGILATPLAWLIFAWRFTGRDRWLNRRTLIGLCAVPAVLYAIVLSDGVFHHLLYQRADTVQVDSWTVLRVTYGPAGWANVAYAYVCLAVGALVIAHAFRASPRIYRRQVFALLASASVPWVVNALYMLGVGPSVDLTPLGFTVTGLGAAWALRHAQLLDLVPVARDRVMESLTDGIAVLDRQDRLVDCNPAFALAIGSTVGACVGAPADRVLGAHPELCARLGRDGDGAGSLMVPSADGTRCYEPLLSPLVDRRGRGIGRLVTLRDVTDRAQVMSELARARDAAEALARAKSEFLATVSHEIRTPMNGVLGATTLLLDTPLDAEQREYATLIRRSGDQVMEIISALDSGRLAVEAVPFAPRATVGEALDRLRPQSETKGLQLHFSTTDAVLERCVGDPTRVRQIVTGRIGAARRRSAAPRRVRRSPNRRG